MFIFTSLQARFFLPVILGLIVLPTMAIMAKDAEAATLATDLPALVIQGNELNTQLSALSLNTTNSCTELGGAIASVQAFTTAIDNVSANLSVPLSLDATSLSELDNLSGIAASIASVLPVLSGDISAMDTSSDLADFQAALDAMLKLSDDIGVMANRILEMADKILVMADNIGEMADLILLTQQIQSSNMAATQAFILATQENMIVLTPTVDTSDYNLPLNNLLNSGNPLVTDMNNTTLTETNMATELAAFEIRVKDYLNSTLLIVAQQNSDSSIASNNINGDTLSLLADLSVINAALADSLNLYAQAVNTLAPNTNSTVLNDALYSMLRLAADIGLMANRMVEIGDNISIMADNIGLMTLRIVETQTLQQSNLALTQANLSSAQITTVSAISAYGL